VPRCVLPSALLAGTVLADGRGLHSFAFYLLLAAIPAVAVSALSFFGDLVEGSADGEAGALYVGLASMALVLLVIAAAVRSNAVDHTTVPALGISAAVGALGLLLLQLVVQSWLHLSRDGLVAVRREHTPGV
jgi:hypothetical protein